jgi:hypothetical protein
MSSCCFAGLESKHMVLTLTTISSSRRSLGSETKLSRAIEVAITLPLILLRSAAP